MADIDFQIRGVESLLKTMRALPVELRKKPARSALGKAAKVIREQAKANAMQLDNPKTSEVIAKNVSQRFSKRYFDRTGDLMVRVGVLGGAVGLVTHTETGAIGGKYTKKERKGTVAGGPGGDTRYWAYVEFGTEHAAAHPFLRPAAEAKAGEAVNVFASELDKALTRLTKRLAKKGR